MLMFLFVSTSPAGEEKKGELFSKQNFSGEGRKLTETSKN